MGKYALRIIAFCAVVLGASAQYGRGRGGMGGGDQGGGYGGFGGGGGGGGYGGGASQYGQGGGGGGNAVARPGGDASLDDSVRLFLQLDQDGDGHLDINELPPALYGLLNYDANNDGRISAAEYLGALRQVQLEMSLDQQCRQQYGNSAEFDGVDACRCKEGFINDNGRCVADQYGIGHQQKLTAGYMEAASVVELSDSTFLQMLQEGGMWVVMFSAPWCTHCTQSKPHFEQAAAMADYQRAQQGLPPGGYQEVQFAMIDGDHYSNIVKHEGIRGFPTIRMYSQGRMVKDYKGDRSVEDILSFAAGVPQGAHHESEQLDSQWRTGPDRSSTGRCVTAARASRTSTASASPPRRRAARRARRPSTGATTRRPCTLGRAGRRR
ncbi:thioredoxin-like protein [Baffinella frigidus]|nr:thioredoxin-like protein [Cryptophyta sp. CCMP2293]